MKDDLFDDDEVDYDMNNQKIRDDVTPSPRKKSALPVTVVPNEGFNSQSNPPIIILGGSESGTVRIEQAATLKAEIQLPKQDQLTVKLVPATLLYSLEEYRSDQSIWFATAGLFVGAALGVLINWVTGGQITTASWVVIGVLLFVACIFGYFYHQQTKRIDRVKMQMLIEGKLEEKATRRYSYNSFSSFDSE